MDEKENDRPIEPEKRWDNAMQWAMIAEWEAARANRYKMALLSARETMVATNNLLEEVKTDFRKAIMAEVEKALKEAADRAVKYVFFTTDDKLDPIELTNEGLRAAIMRGKA